MENRLGFSFLTGATILRGDDNRSEWATDFSIRLSCRRRRPRSLRDFRTDGTTGPPRKQLPAGWHNYDLRTQIRLWQPAARRSVGRCQWKNVYWRHPGKQHAPTV